MIYKHTEIGRLHLMGAANDLRILISTGTILPPALKRLVDATIAALVDEADAKDQGQ